MKGSLVRFGFDHDMIEGTYGTSSVSMPLLHAVPAFLVSA
jgi:hypothetical protein